MQFRNVTREELERALEVVNVPYQDNLQFKDFTVDAHAGRKPWYRLTLRTVRGGVIGSRTSFTGRKINAASWEAHRDFLWALFDINPNADVRSWMERYDGRESFMEKFPATGNVVVGSRANPLTIRDLTFRPE